MVLKSLAVADPTGDGTRAQAEAFWQERRRQRVLKQAHADREKELSLPPGTMVELRAQQTAEALMTLINRSWVSRMGTGLALFGRATSPATASVSMPPRIAGVRPGRPGCGMWRWS